MENKYSDLIKQTFDFPQEGFEVIDDELHFYDIPLMDIIKQYGTPLKITYLPKISSQIQKAKKIFNVAIAKADYKGKYVMLDFWASWCGPCRAENPNVVKAYTKYKDKNFTILGVSLDRPDGKADWQKAIKSDGLSWTQVSDLKYGDNQAAALYFVQAIPSNFLLDPDGKIIAKNLRGSDLDDKLAELFGK